MIRGDEVMAGTQTGGTGTQTLAASPVAPGALDFDKWLKATGLNFASGNAILVPYVIKEFTDTTFSTVKQTEKGIGTLTLGASITAATLARTKIQWTTTSENTQPATPTYASPSAINIGNAANTLIFIGPSAADLLGGVGPYTDTSAGLGIVPMGGWHGDSNAGAANATGAVAYIPFQWGVPALVKRFTARTGNAAYTGGTSNAYGSLYDINTSGQPGKLLIDFGVLGTAGSSLSGTFANIASALHASGFYLLPGFYFAAIYWTFTGGSGNPTLLATAAYKNAASNTIFGLQSGFVGSSYAAASSGGSNPAADPAATGGYFIYSAGGGEPNVPMFTLATS